MLETLYRRKETPCRCDVSSLQGLTIENTIRLIMHFYLGFLLLWIQRLKLCSSGFTLISVSSGSGPTSFQNSIYCMMNKGQILQMLTPSTNNLSSSPLTSFQLWLQNWLLQCSILEVCICLLGFKHVLAVHIPLIVFLSIVISPLIFIESRDRCSAVMKCCNPT